METTQKDLATRTLERALRGGAQQAAVRISRARFVELKRRDGKVESLTASASRGLSVALYVDGRYSESSTNLVEEDAVAGFVERCLAMTRLLAPDAFRGLPEPELYGPAEAGDLELRDPRHADLGPDRQMALCTEAEEAARESSEHVISASAGLTVRDGEALQVHSNGFFGEVAGTGYHLGATVSVQDEDGRKPEDYFYASTRFASDLPRASFVGAEAARRALSRRGSRKARSGRMTLLVENRAAVHLLSSLMEPFHGSLVQQRRSFLEGREGERIGSELLTLRDEPFLRRGLGSRAFDGEGLRVRPRALVEAGTLRELLVDVYYARKLGRAPTGGSVGNLILPPGERSLAELLRGVAEGVLVTSFLGGNSNPSSGDFSFGVSGVYLKDGHAVHPVSEMNVTGNHTRLWNRLSAAGNDPYRFSSWQIPSLLFEDVQLSGL